MCSGSSEKYMWLNSTFLFAAIVMHTEYLLQVNVCLKKIVINRPFPSSCLPPLQSESKCKGFVMVISSTLHKNEY